MKTFRDFYAQTKKVRAYKGDKFAYSTDTQYGRISLQTIEPPSDSYPLESTPGFVSLKFDPNNNQVHICGEWWDRNPKSTWDIDLPISEINDFFTGTTHPELKIMKHVKSLSLGEKYRISGAELADKIRACLEDVTQWVEPPPPPPKPAPVEVTSVTMTTGLGQYGNTEHVIVVSGKEFNDASDILEDDFMSPSKKHMAELRIKQVLCRLLRDVKLPEYENMAFDYDEHSNVSAIRFYVPKEPSPPTKLKSGHMYYGTYMEAAEDVAYCGSCNGANCHRCRDVYRDKNGNIHDWPKEEVVA